MHTPELRVGQGIDVHPFAEGRRLILGGVEIPSDRGLQGHSDADVLVHAVIDAVLGATGRGDVGSQFPDSDEAYRGANSIELLTRVWTSLAQAGWTLVNCDACVLLEAPKLRDYIPAMKACIAGAFATVPDLIGIKPTTAERLGFVGREEGVVASAVVLLKR